MRSRWKAQEDASTKHNRKTQTVTQTWKHEAQNRMMHTGTQAHSTYTYARARNRHHAEWTTSRICLLTFLDQRLRRAKQKRIELTTKRTNNVIW